MAGRIEMTHRGARAAGVIAGLLVGAAVLALADRRADRGASRGVLLSDAGGALQEVVVHYTPEAETVALGALRDWLPRLAADVTVHVVCPDEAAFERFTRAASGVSCRLSSVAVRRPVTCWARDRWLALERAGADLLLLAPREEEGAALWPARAAEGRTACDLAAALSGVQCRRSDLAFDGGDFVADRETVFVAPAVLRRNLGLRVASREALIERLRHDLGRRVVLLDEAPDHHAGMFMMAAGRRTVLVGDPRWGARLDAEEGGGRRLLASAGGPDLSPTAAGEYEAVARRCREEGYSVVRIPTLPARDGRTVLSYVNVLLDERDGAGVVYMPTYSGAERLNAAAEAVWRGLGFRVERTDCTESLPHFGALRCLVNVVRRRPAGS